MTEPHDRLLPLTCGLASDKSLWEEVPELNERYNMVLGKTREVSIVVLTSTMVAVDYLRRRIAPLQARA
jgi:hypothetical protein